MIIDTSGIVVTGFSAITAAGAGIAPILALIGSGADALSPVPEAVSGGHGQRWGKANGFKATDFIPPLKARKMDRCSQFAVAAAGLALKDAAIEMKSIEPERIGIALGCGFGGVANSAEFLMRLFQRRRQRPGTDAFSQHRFQCPRQQCLHRTWPERAERHTWFNASVRPNRLS